MTNKGASRVSPKRSIIRIIVPGYREPYAANDFVHPEARSVDDQIARYVRSSTSRAPWGSPHKLKLRLTEATRHADKESETTEAYRAMFQWRAQAALRKFGRQLPVVALLLVIGVAFLWLSHRVESLSWEEEVAKTTGEAIRLGAWVSGWSAISLLFSQGLESLRDFVAFRHLAKIPIEFEYAARSQHSVDHRVTSARYAS
jgi:hypothetical protein